MVANKIKEISNSVAARHIPVLLSESISYLKPDSKSVIVDGTFGLGGHSIAILEKGAYVIGIDRDPSAIRKGKKIQQKYPKHLYLVCDNFGKLDQHAKKIGYEKVDGILLDLGVSSLQLDSAERGFSFQKEGPLDMRMSTKGTNAKEIVNKMSVRDLIRIIGVLGEEKKAVSVANAINSVRKTKIIDSSRELANIVESAVGRKPNSRIHPATKTFQGLRIFINYELEELANALQAAEFILRKGGRLVVISFHSLEDRIVKKFLTERSRTSPVGSRYFPEVKFSPATFTLPFKRPVIPTEAELANNPRARSSKLRVGIRTANKVHHFEAKSLGIPAMPKYGELGGNLG